MRVPGAIPRIALVSASSDSTSLTRDMIESALEQRNLLLRANSCQLTSSHITSEQINPAKETSRSTRKQCERYLLGLGGKPERGSGGTVKSEIVERNNLAM